VQTNASSDNSPAQPQTANKVAGITPGSSTAQGQPSTTKDTSGAVVDMSILKQLDPGEQASAQQALDVLQRFLGAKSWEERVPLSRNGSIEKRTMEAYYASGKGVDGPIRPTYVRLMSLNKRPDSNAKFAVFTVRTSDMPAGFPVIVDEVDDNYQVAWRLFVEFKDDLLDRFLAGWTDEPESFHVYMNRKHYFSDDIPDLESKVCYQIETPVPGRGGYVFVADGTDLSGELDKQIPWGFRGHPVVHLKWDRGSDGRPFVRVLNIKRYGWGNS